MTSDSTVVSRRRLAALATALGLAVLVCMSGCAKLQDFFKTDRHRFLGPEKVVRPPTTGQPINPIYTSIGPADSSQELVPNATFPREGDWEYVDSDYVLGATDVVNITILDLFYEGVETPLQRTVSTSGHISLPLLETRIRAEGLTIEQLRNAVVEAYRPDVLLNPIVSVTTALERRSVFSIMGAVARPSQYPVTRKDMRLLEAIAMSGDIIQSNIKYIYVIRPAPAIRRSVEPPPAEAPAAITPQQLPELPPEVPAETPPEAPAQTQATQTVPAAEPTKAKAQEIIDIESAMRELGTALVPGPPAATEPATQPAPVVMPHFTEMAETLVDSSQADPTEDLRAAVEAKSSKFVYTTEGWVRVEQEAGVAARPSGQGARPVRPAGPGRTERKAIADQQGSDPYGWRQMDKSGLARIIAIDLDKLRAGDQRNNIIIRNDDVIEVPPLKVGEFYVLGEVLNPGVFNLTGRKLTLKQAIAAASNFAPLAWPQNAVLTRRIGNNQEQTIAVDLEAIFAGREPDIFMKPNDILEVGTDARSMFYAVMRNAFRLTYGFGFIYDRNFANPYFGTLDGKRFSRW